MQHLPIQIRAQQEVLTKLGYYRGKIDGIWGPACIEAKKDFELDSSFRPGYPNNGLPFDVTNPIPVDTYWLVSKNHGKILRTEGLTDVVQTDDKPDVTPEVTAGKTQSVIDVKVKSPDKKVISQSTKQMESVDIKLDDISGMSDVIGGESDDSKN